MNTYFWFTAGILAGLCAALVALPLLRAARESAAHPKGRRAMAAAGIVVFSAAAFFIYRLLGSPESIGSAHVVATPASHPEVNAASGVGTAESMESVVARLEARVTREGGKREDWLLLAQSYDFLGRTAEAQHAREQAAAAGDATTTAAPSTAVTDAAAPAQASNDAAPPVAAEVAIFEKRVRAKPRDADAWQMLSAIYRREHDYAHARDAFAHLVQLKTMSADSWADYADVLASLNSGSLRGAPAQAIDNSLRLDAAQPKALWLKASLAHEEHRYADALVAWQLLRKTLAPDSSDARIVDANIAEAMQLAGKTAAAPPSPAIAVAATAGATDVSGTVSIDSKLAARVPVGATLFIYAKAADSPGPPLAVLRQTAGHWPVEFHLDDTLAMIPSRKLSQFDKVIVEARISRSGQATPAPGDLYVTSTVLTRTQRKKLALIIDHEVG